MTSKEKANKLVSEFYENVYPNKGVAIEAVKFMVDKIIINCKEDIKDHWVEVKEELSKK